MPISYKFCFEPKRGARRWVTRQVPAKRNSSSSRKKSQNSVGADLLTFAVGTGVMLLMTRDLRK